MKRAAGPLVIVVVIVGLFAAASQPPSDARPELRLVAAPAADAPPIDEPTGEARAIAPFATIAGTPPAPAIAVEGRTLAADPRASEVVERAVGWLAATESVDVAFTAAIWVEGHGELWHLHPDRRLFPASNQKLVVGAGAFELLEPEHRFVTRVHRHATEPATAVVVASGDPTLTSDRLDALARSVAAVRGVEPIERLVIDTGRWLDLPIAPGWQDWQIPTYVGPLSPFMIDDNRWSTDDDFVAAPDLANSSLLARALREAGVRGALDVVVDRGVPIGALLAADESPARDELIGTMMRSSDNQVAEALVREIDAHLGGAGDTTEGLARITAALQARGIATSGVDGDGSGLSRHNLRSSREWQDLLVTARDAPWFASYLDTLPIAGRTGTLGGRLSGPATIDNVRAKTGTIIGGRALSGYVTLASGEAAVFSVIVNGEGSSEMLDEIDRFVTDLASITLP